MKNKQTTNQRVAEAKGRPMLQWVGKKPLSQIEYYPAQEKEVYGNKTAKEFNKMFWGDNLQVLSHLLKKYRGKVDLVYIDPPFDSKADYVKKVKFRGKKLEGKQQTLLEEKQYTDIWEKDEYLQFMYERLQLLKELLSDTGSIYLHCDWHKNHLLRCLLDEVFSEAHFRNEIIWQRDAVGKGAKKQSGQWSREVESIFYYTVSNKYTFKPQYKKREELTHTQLKEFRYSEPNKRKFKIVTLGDYSDKSISQMKKKGLIYTSSSGKEYKKYYLDEFKLIVGSKWDDIPNISHGRNPERVDYPTQKPEALLERIIKASSNPGDLV
jgi:adenine-specific DNA-methyltransferase